MDELQKKLGHAFKNRSLLDQALTHPSYRNERDLDVDNQRMEFLGDAALGLAAADFLYANYPDEPEGRMTKLRSIATNTATLAKLARQLDIGTYILLGKGEEKSGGHSKDSNLADALEAIVGAIYLDGGQESVNRVFNSIFADEMERGVEEPNPDNPKGQLQEWAQGKSLPCPTYQVIQTEGPAHDRWFTVRVIINDDHSGEGSGTTKRSAEADAAAKLYEKISAD